MTQIMSNDIIVSKKVKYKRLIFGMLVIIWMMVIFNFSAQNAEKSSAASTAVTEKVVKVVVKDYEQMPKSKQEKLFDKFQFFVRKTAHFSEYALLGILIWLLLMAYNVSVKYRGVASLVISAIYASTDEFHQTFSDGRSPQIKDVCIDSSGALVGILIVTFLFMMAKSIYIREKLQ